VWLFVVWCIGWVLTSGRLVLETLEPLPGDRKCFRMINGVLTERTVKEVVPILQTNSDGLKKALEELVKQYKSRQDEMEKWKVCIVVVGVVELDTDCYVQKQNNIQVVQQPQ
jgi:prefoldin subunit 2